MKRVAVAAAAIILALVPVACGSSGSSTSAKQQQLNELAEKTPELRQSADGSIALLDLSEGDTDGAKAELAEACPDMPPAEAMEHLEEIREAGSSREDLETEIAEDLC